MRLNQALFITGMLPFPLGEQSTTSQEGENKMMTFSFPKKIDDLLQASSRLVNGLTKYKTTLSFPDPLLTESSAAAELYSAKHAARLQKEAELAAAMQEEITARDAMKKKLRYAAQVGMASAGMTDAIGQELGYNLHAAPSPTINGDEVPLCALEPQPGMVIIHWGSDPGNENINSKPDWALGVRIYRRLEPGGTMTFVDTDTSSPYRDHLAAGSHVTYQLAYYGRGENAEGNRSPEYSVIVGG
jgi:hypothetical protein